MVDVKDEYTVAVAGVRLTFLYYPFPLEFKESLDSKIKVADLLTLAALKAYALGRRTKWKDYVDLYFILNGHYTLKQVAAKANKIFGPAFNEKLWRSQLAYFDGLDYSEEVDYLKGFEVSPAKIKSSLVKLSIS
jgi:hypothetical protein